MKIQIKTSNKNNTHTQVSFIAKGTSKFISKENTEILHIVSGKLDKVTPRKLRTVIREAIRSAKSYSLKKVSIEIDYNDFKKCHEYGEEWFWNTVSQNLHLANYEFNTYKTKKQHTLSEVVLLVPRKTKIITQAIKAGEYIANGTSITRDLANTPGGDMTPEKLTSRVRSIFKGTKVKVKILGLSEIKKLKMGGVLGVGEGSKATPRFIILEYKGIRSKTKPTVLVGKGVTFDSGGLQIKPSTSMYEMHMDMSGGAAVVGAMKAITDLGIKKHVVALIPAVENAVGGSSFRPGDVLTMMSGTTVDILHTDAEGRLILADALHYAQRYSPKLIVDVATLTGAAAVAMGPHASVIMTKNAVLENKVKDLGEESGNYVAPLPLWDEYSQHISGVQGDITNIAPTGGKHGGGAITAGAFLSHFVKEQKKWLHIDMAPRMTTIESDKLAKGASGEPTALLVKIVEKI